MSWRAYEILTLSPDFATPPRQGIVDQREESTLGGVHRFTAWPDKTDRILGFTFQTMSANEWKILREFFDRHGGRAKAFYLPSWTADFELAANAAAGENEITIAGNSLSALTENRPDTIGRRLMIYNQAGQLSTHWVTGAAYTGEGTDRVILDPPLAAAAEAGRTVLAICYLVRLTEDTLRSDHASPRHATVELTFREISHRRRLDQEEAAPGVAIASLHASYDIIATDEDPIYTNTLHASVSGPRTYGVPQGTAYQATWEFELNPTLNTVSRTNPAGAVSASTLYTAPSAANHLTAVFDAAAKEILAWELNREITVAWFGGSGPEQVTFPGMTPVGYNTYAIDATVDAGTATVAIFYLREQDASIYCRTSAESFTIEHRYCKSPVAPLALHAARRLDGRIELVGMDTNHRLVRWRSEAYQTPPETQYATAYIEPEITGDFLQLMVPYAGQDMATAMIGDSQGIPSQTGLSGEYRELRVPALAGPDKASARIETGITGTFTEIRIPVTAADSVVAVVVANSMDGSYTLVAIMADPPNEGASASINTTITGSYS